MSFMQNEIKVSPSLDSYWIPELQNNDLEDKVSEKNATRKFIVDTKENKSIISEFSDEGLKQEKLTQEEIIVNNIAD